MSFIQILIIIVVVVVLLVIAYHFIHTTTTANVVHTITLVSKVGMAKAGTVIYSGSSPSVVSSDGVSIILYGDSAGIHRYDTSTALSTIVNTNIPTGLAYDGTSFMVLQAGGLFSRLNADGSLTPLGTGISALYDTTPNGFLISVGGETSGTGPTGSTIPANGNYGPIQLTIK